MYLRDMKILKIILVVLALLCFVEVYYLHSKLSFIDTPFLYTGLILFVISFLLHRFFPKNKN